MKNFSIKNISALPIIDHKFNVIGKDSDFFLSIFYLSDKIYAVEDLKKNLSNKIMDEDVIQSFEFDSILDAMNQMKQFLDSSNKELSDIDFQKNKDYVRDNILRNRNRIKKF